LLAAFQAAGFIEARITARFDCFAGTKKEGTARKYGVKGVNVIARKFVNSSDDPRKNASQP